MGSSSCLRGGEDGGSEVVRVDLSLKARGPGPRGALGPGLPLSMGKGNCFSCSGNPPHSSVFVHLFCAYDMHVSYTNAHRGWERQFVHVLVV